MLKLNMIRQRSPKSLAFLFEEINPIKKQLKPAKMNIPKRGGWNLSSP